MSTASAASRRLRNLALQVALLAGLVVFFSYIASNTVENLEQRGIPTGLGFMDSAAGFDISETPFVPIPSIPLAFALIGAIAVAVALYRPWRRPKEDDSGIYSPTNRTAFYGRLLAPLAIGAGIYGIGILFAPASESQLVTYKSTSTYWIGLITGGLNTLKVSFAAIVAATLLGLIGGVMRTSKVPPLERMAGAFVDTVRNIPLLVQLILWYAIVLNVFPMVQNELRWQHFHLNNRGLFMPMMDPGEDFLFCIVGFAIGFYALVSLRFEARKHQEATGRIPSGLSLTWLLPIIGFGLPFLMLENSASWELPKLVFGGRNIRGGFWVSPEFLALFLGLAIYTAAFIVEITRAGLEAVPKGQIEAARSVALGSVQTFRLITLPQALRVMIPPLISQYLNLIKNSSLAVAIGFPDIVSVGGVILNQDGQALEVIFLWMVFFLATSLGTSLLLNIYNQRVRLPEG